MTEAAKHLADEVTAAIEKDERLDAPAYVVADVTSAAL